MTLTYFGARSGAVYPCHTIVMTIHDLDLLLQGQLLYILTHHYNKPFMTLTYFCWRVICCVCLTHHYNDHLWPWPNFCCKVRCCVSLSHHYNDHSWLWPFLLQGQVLCMSRLEEAVSDADFIFETVIEDLEIKADLLESKTQTVPNCWLCIW